MAKETLGFKMNEADINKVRQAASVYSTTMTEIITEAVHEYLEKLHKDPFYRLSVNVKEASVSESAEILEAIEGLSDNDL
ncbi:MAG: hypothetical protein IJ252_15670, partial [Solobacterium sp.]|nr:hypothetical protein [Solobacterium sp.]